MNAPGVAANCLLIAPPAGRLAFSTKFTTGSAVFYFLDDGTQHECGYGTLTTGSPDIVSRDTVLSNSSGTTSRLNFAGTTRIYNDVPAENLTYKDKFGVVNLGLTSIVEPATGTQTLLISAPSSANGANLKLTGNGGVTASKTLRVVGGVFQILNNAGTSILSLSDAGALTSNTVVTTMVNTTSSGTGSVTTRTGGASQTGYLEFFSASGTRMGYLGWGGPTGPLNLISESTTSGWSTDKAFSVGTSCSIGTSLSVGTTITAGTFNVGQNNGISFTNSTGLTINHSGAVAGTGLNINVGTVTSGHIAFQYNGVTIGSITTNGSNAFYNTTSDYRLKTVHGKDDGTLLSKVPVHDATWKLIPGERQPMILAHELADIAPWAVTGAKDGPVMQQINYTALVPALISYTQALERRIAALESR